MGLSFILYAPGERGSLLHQPESLLVSESGDKVHGPGAPAAPATDRRDGGKGAARMDRKAAFSSSSSISRHRPPPPPPPLLSPSLSPSFSIVREHIVYAEQWAGFVDQSYRSKTLKKAFHCLAHRVSLNGDAEDKHQILHSKATFCNNSTQVSLLVLNSLWSVIFFHTSSQST